MSVDKLVDGTQLDSDLTSIANAIRTRGGTASSLAFPSGFVSAVGAIGNQYTNADEGKVVSNGALVAQTAHAKVTSNGTIDTTLNNSVEVEVSGGGGSPVDRGTFTPAAKTETIELTVTRQITGLMIIAESNPYNAGSGGRTSAGIMYDADGGSQKKINCGSNSAGTAGSVSYGSGFTISQSGNTVTVVNSTGAAAGYYISGVTYRWIAW